MSSSPPVPDPLERLDRQLLDAVPGPITPGAVALISLGGATVFHRAYGAAQTHDEHGPLEQARPMVTDAIFDIASMTKTLTTAAVMRLESEGAITLDTPVNTILDLAPGCDPMTVDHLLTHRSGLGAWQPIYLHTEDRDEALAWVCRHGAVDRPGRRRRYSDLGFMLLGGIVEEVTGERLDTFLEQEILEPCGMASTRFNPSGDRRQLIAATSTGNRAEQRMIETGDPYPVDGSPDGFARWRTHTLVGEVQDGNAAYAFGGVAGSAGAFSTASDLAAFGAVLSDTVAGADGPWSRSTLERFAREPYDRGQGRGWWTRRCGWQVGDVDLGHGGFTGCEMVVVPQAGACAVLLTNRLHTERDPPPDHTGLWRMVLDALRGLVAR